MSRVTAIICGLLLFGLGLFFGMVGSFIRTLSPETPQAQKIEARAKPVVNLAQRVAAPKPSKATQPPPAVESALSQALAMVAVALDSQSAPSAAVAPGDVATNAPEQHPLELLMPAAAGETARAEPPADAPPVATPPPPSQSDQLAGHWVFDQRLGWLWLSENTPSVVIVPVIEVFPGGLITIHAGSGTAASRTSRKSTVSSPSQQRRVSVIQHETPGSTRRPATSPFPSKN
ncbi:MAG: hypothetical protein HZA88_16290 [Verrucomicrobia bacterium]|nr:hypothetical protein [Verrucomicrobiota bacterium]